MKDTRRARGIGMAVLWMVSTLILSHGVHGKHIGRTTTGSHERKMREMQAIKASLIRRSIVPSLFWSPRTPPPQVISSPIVYRVTSYGADPTGKSDSTDAILNAMRDAFDGPSYGELIDGVKNLGGARIDLEGGSYLISRPLRFPSAGAGNVVITGGTLRASENFTVDGYLIDLSDASSKLTYVYEYVTIRDILFDCNFRGGGIAVVNSIRTTIDNCYITHFGDTNGILSLRGHETYIRNSFLGQHVTAGGDKGERSFSGVGINLAGNDNAVTDTVIFSARIGIMISGQANLLSGVHCYNKATGFGGTGIYVKLPGLTQTRILNSYMDYTGIVAEDPVQLEVSGTFFLGDAFILLKSINGVVRGVNIVDNTFSGSGRGVQIVQLDQANKAFNGVDQVVVDRNIVSGMAMKSTVAKGSVGGKGTTWTVDFSNVLLFPNLIKHVQYSLMAREAKAFPLHALRNVSGNRVVVDTTAPVAASVYVTVEQ